MSSWSPTAKCQVALKWDASFFLTFFFTQRQERKAAEETVLFGKDEKTRFFFPQQKTAIISFRQIRCVKNCRNQNPRFFLSLADFQVCSDQEPLVIWFVWGIKETPFYSGIIWPLKLGLPKRKPVRLPTSNHQKWGAIGSFQGVYKSPPKENNKYSPGFPEQNLQTSQVYVLHFHHPSSLWSTDVIATLRLWPGSMDGTLEGFPCGFYGTNE